MRRRDTWVLGGLLLTGATLLWTLRPAPPTTPAFAPGIAAPPVAPADDHAPSMAQDDARVHAFRVPTGDAPGLTCEEARRVVQQARSQLAYVPEAVNPHVLGEAAADWLDPYGLWSVAPDSPVAAAFDSRAGELLADLEGRSGRDCTGARALGNELVAWMTELRGEYNQARADPSAVLEDVATAASSPAFEGATVTRPARTLAATLGHRAAALDHGLGAAAEPYTDAARQRFFPGLDAEGWAHVVLAAAVRAYVPTINPHGAWAPLDEESSVYEVDLEARPPSRLWDKAERTAVGVHIESGATPRSPMVTYSCRWRG